jgi:hypothetical protein
VLGCVFIYEVKVDCKDSPPRITETIDTSLIVGREHIICIDTNIIAGTVTSIKNVCETEAVDMLEYEIDSSSFCVTYTAKNPGISKICIEICNAEGDCDTMNINITIMPLAVLDTVRVSVKGGATDTLCLLSNMPDASIDTFFNYCRDAAGFATELMLLEGTSCLEFTGIGVGIDTACMVICDTAGMCDTTIVLVSVEQPKLDTVKIDLSANQDTLYCVNTSELGLPIASFENSCAKSESEIAQFTLDSANVCVNITPLKTGIDTACLVVCNDFGFCDTTILLVKVALDQRDSLPIAIDNDTSTAINTAVLINVLANDTLNGSLVNLGIIENPKNGTIIINPDNSITYNPNENFCGTQADTFSYFIDNGVGLDTAIVKVLTRCSDLTVFNAFSPNGDGVNDRFVILGIEAFPNNEVSIFSRWGNEVFTKTLFFKQKMAI